MPDTLSDRTKTTIATTLIAEQDDFYPDRSATPDADGDYDIVDGTDTVVRNPRDDVPTTTQDMSNLFKWEKGDRIRGTHAKDSLGMKMYMDDINEAWGNENDYYDGNVIYIDTLDKKKRVSEKLKELKR